VTKDHILQEVRRTAEANGGVCLGKEKFFQETGIREADWKGKFWVRWSEAVREAGFEPNQMTSALDETLLIEKFIVLARELKRFPVTAEIRMKKRSDATFPNDKTYRTRFGTTRQLAAKIYAYCSERTDYDDVAELCAIYLGQNGQEPDADKATDKAEHGFVYLMKSGRFYKIGKSNAAGRREYELAIQLPEKLKTVHTIRTDDPTGIEEYWHKRFAAKRKHGEWFDLEGSDVSAFRRRKFM
jgi:Meiotically up-regulated gene 113